MKRGTIINKRYLTVVQVVCSFVKSIPIQRIEYSVSSKETCHFLQNKNNNCMSCKPECWVKSSVLVFSDMLNPTIFNFRPP